MPRARRRRAVRPALTIGLFALGVMAALTVALCVAGVSIGAGPLRDPLAGALARALERPVRIEGDARLRLSLRPAVELTGLRVGSPPGFGDEELAALGAARLELDLLPLLRGNVVVREFTARDLQVRLVRRADGIGNWQRAPEGSLAEAGTGQPARAAETVSDDASTRPPEAGVGVSDLASLRLERIVLERIALKVVDPRGGERRFDLDRLDASAGGEEPLSVRIAGRVEDAFPYTLRIDGGPLSALMGDDTRWPLDLALSFAGTEARITGWVQGLFAPASGGTRTDFAVSLASEDLSQLERLLQARLPAVGRTRLAFRVTQAPGVLGIASIDGAMGATTLEGALRLDTLGPRPRLTGELRLPTLDLRPFLGRPDSAPAPRNLLDTWRELARTTVDLSRLRGAEADLTVTVGRWLSLPGDARDARLVLRLAGGRLHSPVEATVGGARLRGEFIADASGPQPRVRLALGTRASPLGGLGALLTGIEGLDGQLERLDVAIEGRGTTLGAIARGLSARLAVDGARLSYGNVAGGRPVSLRLDQLALDLPPGQGVRARASGALLEEAFSAQLEGSDLATLANEGRVRFDLRAQASGARIGLGGDLRGLDPATDEKASVALAFSVSAPRAGSVGRWFGLSPQAAVPFELRGELESRPDLARLQPLHLRLGRLALEADARREGPAGGRPRLIGRLRVHSIDLDELLSLLPPRPPRKPGSGDFEAALRLPLLPRDIPLVDAEVDLSVARARAGALQASDLRLRGRLLDGELSPTPVDFTLAGAAFAGTLAASLRAPMPDVRLKLATRALDAGDWLARLGVAVGLDATVDEVEADAALRGSTLADLLAHSSLHARLQGGRWTPRSAEGVALARLALDRGTVDLAPGQPLRLRLAAAIDRTPVDLRLESGRLAELARPGSAIPVAVEARAAGAHLRLVAQAQTPIGQARGTLALQASGERLDSLDPLARVALPPWGPWSLSANVSTAGGGYRLESMTIGSGSTRLEGEGRLDLSTSRPRVTLALRTQTLQLDDFPTAGWSATARPASPPRTPPTAGRALEEAAAVAREGQRLLSREALMRQDARLDVRVDQVRAGRDRLGGGQLSVGLEAGSLRIDPLRVSMPGGEALIRLGYEPLAGDREARVDAQVRIDRFDYGVLARRLRPDAAVQGRFSAHADLIATAPLDRLLARGDGRIDLAVWPVDLRAGIFDLWAVNVFVAMLPALDPAAASRINCAIGRFDLRDGQLREERLVIDSTRLRASGRARVDLRDGSLEVRMQPKPKEAQFFSLQTPVEVTGRVDDFRVGLPAGSIPATVVRFAGSLVTTPLQWLMGSPLAADGADVCAQPMRPPPAQPPALRYPRAIDEDRLPQ